jgi:hypothetical protein
MGTDSTTQPTISERAAAYAEGLRNLAKMIEGVDNDAVLDDYDYALRFLLMPVESGEDLAAHIRFALRAGAKISKKYDDAHAGAYLSFGPVRIQAYGTRAQVCERVVVGTREVEEEIPDPEALAAVPKVTVKKTVEDIEWVCSPLLAGAEPAEALAGVSA